MYSILKEDVEKSSKNINTFWTNNFPNWPKSKWDWFYKNNPFGKATCWTVSHDDSKDLIGATAIFPRDIFIRGKKIRAGITGDFGVNKNHRILGPALKLQRETANECKNGNFDILYGYPNPHSEPVQRRVGFHVVGTTVRMVKVLKSSDYVKRRIKQKLVAFLVSGVIDIILKIKSKIIYTKNSQNLKCKIETQFDNRFDELWQKNQGEFGIVGEKSSDFLNWRFAKNPLHTYQAFTLSSRADSSLKGYIVYSIQNNQVCIADLLVQKEDMELLISEFLKYFSKEKYSSISLIYLGDESVIDIFKKFSFSVRDAERKIVTCFNSNIDADFVLDKNNWFLWEGDND